MDVRRVLLLMLLVVATTFLPGCRAIATIFEAGMWVGLIMVVVVLAVVGLLVSLVRRS